MQATNNQPQDMSRVGACHHPNDFTATGHHLPPGDVDSIFVQMEFVDNNAVKTTSKAIPHKLLGRFDATQTDGEEK
jgi:hypothetical protein